MIDRKRFFDAVRASLFAGRLNQGQVDGCTVILDEAERRGAGGHPVDLRWTAYILATAFHETARTMRPIEEYGRGRGKPYGAKDPKTGKAYYGRGFVQLTWAENYSRMGQLLRVPLHTQPELALRPSIAVKILFEGMIRGSFTGAKLADHISGSRCDYRNARRIVNGMDRADLIAGHAVKFEAALAGASRQPSPSAPLPSGETVAGRPGEGAPRGRPSEQVIGWLVAALITAGAGLAAWLGLK